MAKTPSNHLEQTSESDFLAPVKSDLKESDGRLLHLPHLPSSILSKMTANQWNACFT